MNSEMQTCPVCGSQSPVGSRFCANCGHSMSPDGERARAEAPAPSDTPPQGSPTVNIGGQPAPSAHSAPFQQPGQTAYIPPQASYPGNLAQSNLPTSVQSYSQAPLASGQQYTGGIIPAGMQRDPIIAFVLELVGYVFVLGLGHMYAGRVGRGIALMVGYWLYWGIAGLLFLTVLFIPVSCLMMLLHPVVPLLSGLWAKRDLDRERAPVGGQYRSY